MLLHDPRPIIIVQPLAGIMEIWSGQAPGPDGTVAVVAPEIYRAPWHVWRLVWNASRERRLLIAHAEIRLPSASVIYLEVE